MISLLQRRKEKPLLQCLKESTGVAQLKMGEERKSIVMSTKASENPHGWSAIMSYWTNSGSTLRALGVMPRHLLRTLASMALAPDIHLGIDVMVF
mmetsp:Transcript_16679/g.36554  ORF Transcript_16679/g.36554 Transcript_16679/m.36554 type:complete len:95 (+) Transcript_16679:894-1178(+)